MISRFGPGLAGILTLIAAGMATAQDAESTNRVAAETDWSVFVEDDPTECWAVSQPKETVNTRDGRVVAVRRGEILLFTFFRPSAGIAGQVTFTGGYPFAEDSRVSVQIGDDSFELYTEGEWAWPATPEDDARLIAAMKGGVDAVLTARSTRGTTTEDTFSLMGYTAAIEEAERRCSAD